MRTALLTVVFLLCCPSTGRAQSCFGFPEDFGVYPLVGFQRTGDGTGGIAGGIAISGVSRVAARLTYARLEFDRLEGLPQGVQLPKGNGFRLEVAVSPRRARGRLCWVTALRYDDFGRLLGQDLSSRQIVIGPAVGYGGGKATSVHVFVSPQLRFVAAELIADDFTDTRWAVEGGMGLRVDRAFLRIVGAVVRGFDDPQIEAVVGTWVR